MNPGISFLHVKTDDFCGKKKTNNINCQHYSNSHPILRISFNTINLCKYNFFEEHILWNINATMAM